MFDGEDYHDDPDTSYYGWGEDDYEYEGDYDHDGSEDDYDWGRYCPSLRERVGMAWRHWKFHTLYRLKRIYTLARTGHDLDDDIPF